MKMTLEEYIKNPMGVSNAVFSQRSMYKDLYTNKFNNIMLREAGSLVMHMYREGDTKFVLHIKIPSEVVPKFYYDVVLEFTTKNPLTILSTNLNNYDIRFYSNDPAFVFTFAYSFSKNDLFITDLASKMSRQALSDRAKEKNPKNIVGYVKSIYFAYIYIKAHGIDKKAVWSVEAKPYNVNTLLADIMQADDKIALRQRLGLNVEKAKEANKKAAKLKTRNIYSSHDRNNEKFVKMAKTVGKIKTARTVKYTKRK